MESSKLQALEKLSDDLKRQLKPLLTNGETWHIIEVDIVRDTLRKMYDLLSTEDKIVEDTTELEPEKEQTIEEVSEKVDRETEELLNISSQDFGLLFDTKPQHEKHPLTKKSNTQQPKLRFEIVKEETESKQQTPNISSSEASAKEEQTPNISSSVASAKEEQTPNISSSVASAKEDQTPNISSSEASAKEDQTTPEAKPVSAKTPDRTLGENILSKPIDSLKRNIGINDKFQFINELFNGKMKIYNEKISQIDELTSLSEAQKLVAELHDEFQWDEESAVYMQFLTYIKRRFA